MRRTPRARRPSGRSVRVRMTLLYGGLFTVITLGVLTGAQELQVRIVGAAVQDMPQGVPVETIPCDRRPPAAPCSRVPYRPQAATGQDGAKPLVDGRARLRQNLVGSQRTVTLVAVALIAVLAFAVCWWLTGRLLRPLHRITATARRLSLSTLHERIALDGAQDELKELADTFDAMLDRLESAAAAQRRFVANASHELRTPLAIQRTAIEVGLANPAPANIARIRAEMLRNTERSERLIEGLLVLAQGERGLDTRAAVDLGIAVTQVVEEHLPLAERAGVAVTTDVHPVTVAGDEVMLVRSVANLVQNAIKHNHRGGRVLVELTPDTGLTVRNTGPRVPPDEVDGLFEPFRRLHRDRTGSQDGVGLGLSIVAAVAHAHGGTVHAAADPSGGLSVTLALPAGTFLPTA